MDSLVLFFVLFFAATMFVIWAKSSSGWGGAPARKLEAGTNELPAREHEREQERVERLMQMPTSSRSHIIGYRIIRQIRLIRVDDCATDDQADLRLREEAQTAGAHGIINMQVRPYPGGKFSAQGDAVVLEIA